MGFVDGDEVVVLIEDVEGGDEGVGHGGRKIGDQFLTFPICVADPTIGKIRDRRRCLQNRFVHCGVKWFFRRD